MDWKKNFGSPKDILVKKQKENNKLVMNESPIYNVKNLKINFFKIIKKQKEKSQKKVES